MPKSALLLTIGLLVVAGVSLGMMSDRLFFLLLDMALILVLAVGLGPKG